MWFDPAQLMRSEDAPVATSATSATFAQTATVNIGKVARVAKVAMPLDLLAANGETHWHWLVHFADRKPLEIYFNPGVSIDRVLADYPCALTADAIPERVQQVFTAEEDAGWNALWVKPDEASCATCLHSRRPGGVSRYCCARTDLPPVYGDGHPLRMLPDEGGQSCEQWLDRTTHLGAGVIQ